MRPVADRLADIEDALDDLDAFTAGLTAETFTRAMADDRRTMRAVRDALTQIGEAIKALPPETKVRHPHIDWAGFAGLRDVLVHQ